MMASYIEAQLAERLACVAKPMRYSSRKMMCESVNERIVAMAITREARSHNIDVLRSSGGEPEGGTCGEERHQCDLA